MPRLPNEKQLLTRIDFSIDFLDRVRMNVGELLRRREHEVSDGYPSSSLGGSGGSSDVPSPTESAALANPIPDPTGRFIDIVFSVVEEMDDRAKHGDACLSNVFTVEQEMRGRISAVVACDCCAATITGINNDRRRDGFCFACYQAWRRYWREAADPSRVVFIDAHRRKRAARQRAA